MKNRILLGLLVISVMYGCSGPQKEITEIEVTDSSVNEPWKEELFDMENFIKAEPFYEANRAGADSAIYYYELLIDEGLKPIQQLYVLTRLAWVKSLIKDPEVYAIYKAGYDLRVHVDSANLHMPGMVCFYLGRIHEKNGHLDSALFYFDEAHQYFRESIYKEHTFYYSILEKLAGRYHWELEDYTNAEKYYLKCEQLIESGKIEFELSDYQLLLYRMASIYRYKREFDKAQIYCERALDLADSLGVTRFMENSRALQSNIYRDQEEWELARSLNLEAISINDSAGGFLIDKAIYFNNMAFIMINLRDFQEALRYCEMVRDVLDRMLEDLGLDWGWHSGILKHEEFMQAVSEISDSKVLLDVIEQLGISYDFSATTYSDMGNPSLAYRDYAESLRLRKIRFGINHTRVAQVNRLIGNHFARLHELDSALSYYQKSLISGSNGFDERDIRSNPTVRQMEQNLELIETLRDKAMLLKTMFDRDTSDRQSLAASLDCYIQCDSLIDFVWNSYANEGARLYLETVVYPIYRQAIEVACQLYQSDPSDQVLGDLYQFMESSRYKLLSDNMTSIQAFARARVPEDLIARLRETDFTLQYLERKKVADSEKTDYYISRIHETMRQKDRLNETINSEYPEVSGIKTALKTVPLEVLQEHIRGQNVILIEYYSGGDYFVVLSTNGETSKVSRIELDAALEEDIDFLVELGGEDPMSLESFTSFAIHSVDAYQKLIEPVLEFYPIDQDTRLVIVPDGNLNRLSFDALVRTMPDTSYVDYTKPDYLVKYHPISYAFSSGMIITDEKVKLFSRRNRVLALSYGVSEGYSQVQSDLKWANQELDAIRAQYRGKFLKDSLATETLFKEYVADYQIIHLALHGQVAAAENDSTMLIFRTNEADPDDGLLLPEELYTIKLKADLVVLSSCDSGLGRSFQGEGVYSMARAFANAGCPSLVSTLWQIPDRYAVPLMTRFYEGLRHKLNPDQALQKSKLDYLYQANQYDAHPKCWSAFIPVGRFYL